MTGASKGIGLAIAEGLLALGMTVFLGARDRVLAYNTSKTALNAVTVGYANELRTEGILGAVSPGSVATDQNGHQGVLTTEQGARLPIRMAVLPSDGPTGTAVTAAEDLAQHPLPW